LYKIKFSPIYTTQLSIRKSTRKQFSIAATPPEIALRYMPA
jgi:hypothetical protein